MKLTDKKYFEIRGPINPNIEEFGEYEKESPKELIVDRASFSIKRNALEIGFQDGWRVWIYPKNEIARQCLVEIKEKTEKNFIGSSYQKVLETEYC